MIEVNLCKIDNTGKFIELNFNSDIPSALFTKVLLYTYDSYQTSCSHCKDKGIDLSYKLEKIDNKEAFLIDLMDLGFPNALNLFIIKLENDQNETITVATANVTDIVLENLEKLSSLKLDNNCNYADNCGGNILDDILYTHAGINALPVLLQLKKFDEAKNLYYSLNNILTLPCEVCYKEFTIYTSDNNIKFDIVQTITE